MATLRDRVLDAVASVKDADGVIVHGAGRVLAWRPPSLNGGAVLIALEDETPTRCHPVQDLPADGDERLRADARNHPVQLDLPWIE